MNVLNLQVAFSYANAWFKHTQEVGLLEAVYPDVLLLEQVMRDNKHLMQVLHAPIIPNEKKLAIFQELFSRRVHPLTLTFFAIINKKRREGYLLLILERFIEIYRAHHQIQLASITSACKLTADLVDYVKELVKDWKSCQAVILQEQIDATILGGFILRVGDEQLDNSLVNRLAKMKKAFSTIPN